LIERPQNAVDARRRGHDGVDCGYAGGSLIGSARIDRRSMRESSEISTGSVIRTRIGARAMPPTIHALPAESVATVTRPDPERSSSRRDGWRQRMYWA
jgi:hypothetical protein